jgi:formate hydrogenlyase subunit 6/NADH:ubiquinone oxidoreductase subunit I
MSHHIDENCTGCTACVKVCPVDAIIGERKKQHSIDAGLCIDCGACGWVCPAEAVRDHRKYRVPAKKKSEWLKPFIDPEKCTACENCVAACPADALSMKDELLPPGENLAVLSSPDKCISCAWCQDNCQFDAIRMGVLHEDH